MKIDIIENIRMISKDNIIKNIKRLMIIFVISLIISSGFIIKEGLISGILISFLFTFILGCIFIYSIIRAIIIYNNPYVLKVFKRYKSTKKINSAINELLTNSIYNDGTLIISKEHLSKCNDFSTIIDNDKIVWVYPYIKTFNYQYEEISIIIFDEQNNKYKYRYKNKRDSVDNVQKVCQYMNKICKNAIVGYSAKTKKEIKNNK